jgi:hypothetical protein
MLIIIIIVHMREEEEKCWLSAIVDLQLLSV